MVENEEVTMNRAATLIATVVGFVLGLAAVWVYWARRREEGELSDMRMGETERLTLEPRPAAPVPEPAAEVEREPNDLTRIEGIGPKISQVLGDAGIVTFSQVAESGPDRLEGILREEDERLARLADPTTWPEQASLAAAGAWDALEELQEELTAGRRV